MTWRKCRDCNELNDEEEDDPAPALCPTCYGKRLAQIGGKFDTMCESLGNPLMLTMWLEEALIDIAGETPEWAHVHATALFVALSES